MRIAKSVAELIGRTPMLELTHFEQTHCLNAHLLAKVESFNPGGSVKDRIALGMVEAAEKAGKLLPGGTIIEPTSGNTGIGLAMVAAARGYTAIIVMPDSMSVERRQLMLAYGAKLVLTPGKLGMKGAVDKANELAAETPNAIVVGQFVNPANPCHPPRHDWPGNLGGHGRSGGCARRGHRHGRHADRHRQLPAREEPGCAHRRGRAVLPRPCCPRALRARTA